jgi:hypothetical protein
MEEEVTIFALASESPVVTTVSLGGFSGEISVTTTRVDKGDDSGAGLFHVDVSVSDSVPSFSSYNILSSSDSNSFISLTDVKGNAWTGSPLGVSSNGSGYSMILETVGKKGTTYSEISVTSTGSVAKKGASLTSLQVIGEEVTYGADLNGDGQVGLLPAGTRADYGSNATAVYVIDGVGHGILADGATYLTPLTDAKGNAWSGAPIGVNPTATGYELVLETVGKKGTTYSEISVTTDGQVAKKGASLTSLKLIGEEVTYNADLNQDNELGLLPSGARSDSGTGSTALYEITGVGHGILADGATYLTPLTDAKGNAWSGVPIGVNPIATGYTMVLETAGKKATTYSEISVDSDGAVAKKGAKLDSLDLIGLESTYGTDFNKDSEIGLKATGARIDYGTGENGVYEVAGAGYGMSVAGSDTLIALTDSKGNAWDGGMPIGLTATATGYTMVVEKVGKKASSFTEHTVSSTGAVSKKGTKVKEEDLSDLEVTYVADLNQDGEMTGVAQEVVTGTLVKGPLGQAVVGLDLDGDGEIGPNEPQAITDKDGNYSLATSDPDVVLIATTTPETVDASSGEFLPGVVLKAPAGAKVITPATTILEATPDIEPAQLATALGIPTSAADGTAIDLTTFNPYAEGADPAAALAAEKAAQSVMVTIKAVSSAAEGAGLSEDVAFEQAMASVTEVVAKVAETVALPDVGAVVTAPGLGEELPDASAAPAAFTAIDFSNSDLLGDVTASVKAKVTTVMQESSPLLTADFDPYAFNDVLGTAVSAVANVNEKINEITDTDLTSSNTMGAFALMTDLNEQLETAAVQSKAYYEQIYEFVPGLMDNSFGIVDISTIDVAALMAPTPPGADGLAPVPGG